jgi:hypothetical protein
MGIKEEVTIALLSMMSLTYMEEHLVESQVGKLVEAI